MREEITRQLLELAEPEYRDFHCKLIPGVDKERVLGVRVPAVRKAARQIAKKDWNAFLEEWENCGSDARGIGGTVLFYEEVMLQGMVIAAAKMEPRERLSRIEKFVPRIDNWAVCDTFCGDLKFADQEENRQLVWDFLQPYLADSREYYLRFGIVMLLGHYIDDVYIDRILALLEGIRHEAYYVKMAAAWALSMCYIKFPKKTEALLRKNSLDDFTHNKTIQKIKESYRVSKEDKQRLTALKRK